MGDGVQSRVFRFSPVLFLIFTSLFVGVLSIITTFLVVPAFEADSGSASSIAKLVGVCVGFLLVLVFVIYAATYKIIVTADSLVVKSLFSRRELFFEEVKGFKVVRTNNSNDLHFILKSKKKFKMALFMQNKKGFYQVLNDLLVNLDLVDAVEEYVEVEANDGHNTDEELQPLIRKADKLATIYKVLAIGISIWVVFKPVPYSLAIWVTILWPLGGFLLAAFFPRVIKFNSEKASLFPSVYIGMTFPSLALALSSLFRFSILSFKNIIAPLVIVAGIMLILYFVLFADIRKSAGSMLLAFAVSIFFGLGVILNLNAMYDKSEPDLYQCEILKKHDVQVSKRGPSYNLSVAPFGSKSEPVKVQVSKKVYSSAEVSDKLSISLKKGFLNVPWYRVGGVVSEDGE
ncbi:MAG: hypothetical protein JXR63_02970 [Spirochaetales bacterium]|nr:hypothetical protein [Spirochaetales bacterium]